ncbi:MAG: helix-turn-helix transcriptional regulator [Bacteroidetes bacterium]|nr:helix-turn-helix transcriptional regulator [Bacteroidota bacterium]
MVQSKTNLFDEELVINANIFKALSHPARLSILQFLAQTRTCITGDISDQIPLGRTTVNQHIKELKDVGLIIGNTSGVKTNYCLNPKKVKEVSQLLIILFGKLNMRECC